MAATVEAKNERKLATSVALEPEQIAGLDRLGERVNRSRAELIRMAIDRYLEQEGA